MPKKPIDFSKCCIYKVQHIDKEDLLYVGHTTNFTKRKNCHKSCCNNENNSKHNQKLYQMMRENGGFDMFRMIEIEKYPCNDKREAEKRENDIMKELKAILNTINSYVSEEEKKKYQSDYSKEYYEANKEKIIGNVKNYCKENKEKIREKSKKYREANKEAMKEYLKLYGKMNKDKRKVYNLLHKDKIKERHRKYYEKNKEKIRENKKEYNIKNKDLIKDKRRIRYLKDKEKLKEHNQ